MNLHLMIPEIALIGLSLVILLADLFVRPEKRHLLGWWAAGGLSLILAAPLTAGAVWALRYLSGMGVQYGWSWGWALSCWALCISIGADRPCTERRSGGRLGARAQLPSG